ncbi:hypothetical protein CO038_01880 [Candidatus Pacearchaeota archaeon CG_4_9_14_0_2_um_filter_39_13]|nr:hypothetical protein [Candidatus Pacearchaeota archaeon]OIO43129.1 MAG: hypothetical protein AUJ64_03030 [Candidatus Pacearchaeota archaeon CG1_02_39_14]PJC44697.1 MAG: hypothetical protein CO038_01880 [Candidatus Pacearchaeota archaeon CG_4_9_14_0_2_um_filter_39_13]
MNELAELANAYNPQLVTFGVGAIAGAAITGTFALYRHLRNQAQPEPGVFYSNSMSPDRIIDFKKIERIYAIGEIKSAEWNRFSMQIPEERRNTLTLDIGHVGKPGHYISIDFSNPEVITGIRHGFADLKEDRKEFPKSLEGKQVLQHYWGSTLVAISRTQPRRL